MSAFYVNAGLVPLQSRLPDTFKNSWIFCNPPCRDYNPCDEIHLWLHPVSRKLMTSCRPREINLNESYLEISEAMPLVRYALQTYLECVVQVLANVPELRRAGTTFDGE